LLICSCQRDSKAVTVESSTPQVRSKCSQSPSRPKTGQGPHSSRQRSLRSRRVRRGCARRPRRRRRSRPRSDSRPPRVTPRPIHRVPAHGVPSGAGNTLLPGARSSRAPRRRLGGSPVTREIVSQSPKAEHGLPTLPFDVVVDCDLHDTTLAVAPGVHGPEAPVGLPHLNG
jgi:hypothetical protein